jgi:hypothetical protein
MARKRYKNSAEVKAQIGRIQSYTHNTGVSSEKFFRAAGRVSSAVRSGNRLNPFAPKDRHQTNGYLLKQRASRGAVAG